MRLHLIAIGGSAMHNMAIALSLKGHIVTGSDDAIYEPSRTRLARHKILPEQMGWFPENITADIDAVILGMHARADNPELVKAQELGLKVYSYPEYIYEQSKEKIRVVIGGSHGKTTITSMILHVLNACNTEFDYLVGAQLEGFDTMVKISDAPVMVIEGDEYLASPIDRRPKFHLYRANIGVISGIAWDHINVFPTFESYIEQFKIFLKTIETGGTIIYNTEDSVVRDLVESSTESIIKTPYQTSPNFTKDGITYLEVGGQSIPLMVFGDHNLQNLEAARGVCNALGISDVSFNGAIRTFKGAAKRLELLGKNDYTAVYKDFAHSPSKLRATLNAVKQQYPDRELVAVMELHTFSSLNKEFLSEYKGCMDNADTAVVFINRRTFEQKNMVPYDENQVIEAFDNDKLIFFNNSEILVEFLSYINYKSKNLLLMSSGDFGGVDLNMLANKALTT
ncbi:UDP-N-acetylmuramate--L-alanine ligase [Paradesertivirga mongoliensis]|uniref:UDP-N-acetylmuramate--L-alanine ligase n=1 Tax=Paradesertivirga mongoliensis TaxID=2100740 RepID=A0ABW4ZMY6_9SPHI|nr:Mur ligase family protein [Pedobacter mongoliensis]